MAQRPSAAPGGPFQRRRAGGQCQSALQDNAVGSSRQRRLRGWMGVGSENSDEVARGLAD